MSSDGDSQVSQDTAGNVLLRARNGDIIRFDDTGLILQLSDQVVDDLRGRLLGQIDPEVLGDVDAWDVQRQEDWFLFHANLPGMKGARRYRRLVSGGDSIAETPGPVLGVLSIGGARRTRAFPGIGAFPYHVVAAADEVGAVGLAGIDTAIATDKAQVLREQTVDSMLAGEMLALRQAAGRGLPLIVARTETDRSASLVELSEGVAFQNLLQAAENLNALAGALGKKSKIACISVDFTLEDVMTPASEYTVSLGHFLQKLTGALWDHGFAVPTVLALFDATAPTLLHAQYELALAPSEASPVFSMPSYALDMDEFARPTKQAMQNRAATEAAALAEIEAGRFWQCPVLLLAEWDGTGRIRLRSNSASPLQIDPQDPFGSGASAGFRLEGPDGEITIMSVAVDDTEPRDVLIEPKGDAPRTGLKISYAWNGPGALRDSWEHPIGRPVQRWALPAMLEVHG